MILNFVVDRQSYGEYCLHCHKKGTIRKVGTEKLPFFCHACGKRAERMLIIDPGLKWWVNNQGHYCHESVGCALVRPDGRILFFELTKFPFGFTIPAGHVDTGETPEQAVIREIKEEAGLKLTSPKIIAQLDIEGDSCRRGADDHTWSIFKASVSDEQAKRVILDAHEGKHPKWVLPAEVQKLKLPQAIDVIFKRYEESFSA